jgi:hypothetical protein
MSNVAVINAGSSVSLTFLKEGGKSVAFELNHPSFEVVASKLKAGTLTYDEAVALQNPEAAVATKVETYTSGKCTVDNGQVCYNGKPVHSVLANRIISFMQKKLPFEHLLRFMERLYSNPSAWAVESLFPFLETKGFPITEDGCFIGYKAVRKTDYRDLWEGTCDFTPGKSKEVLERKNRNQVDDNRQKECSFGYHVGTLSYAQSYGSGRGQLILVKVAPEDVVSVPSEGQAQKIRCVWLESLSDYHNQNVIEHELVDENMNGFDEYEDDDYEDDYEDEGYLDEYFDEDEYEDCSCEECTSDEDVVEDEPTEAPKRTGWFGWQLSDSADSYPVY